MEQLDLWPQGTYPWHNLALELTLLQELVSWTPQPRIKYPPVKSHMACGKPPTYFNDFPSCKPQKNDRCDMMGFPVVIVDYQKVCEKSMVKSMVINDV